MTSPYRNVVDSDGALIYSTQEDQDNAIEANTERIAVLEPISAEVVADVAALEASMLVAESDIDDLEAQDAEDAALKVVLKEPTGFTTPEDVVVTYDSSTRKITVSGTFTAYWLGEEVTALTDGWVSDAHTDTTGHTYFLYYDGTDFAWTTDTFPGFEKLLIAFVSYGADDKFALRECHGFMQWQTHKAEHYTIGTWKYSGGTCSDYTLDDTTAAERRLDVDATVIQDEDLPTTLPALSTKAYTQGFLATTGIIDFNVDATDIVALSTANPYYNSFSTPNWGQTLMPANSMMSVWVYAIPTSADASSQKYRFVFLQGQWVTQAQNSSGAKKALALEDELKRTPAELNLGTLTSVSPELVAVARIVIWFTTDWSLADVSVLAGNKFSQIGSPSGNFLTTVAIDGITLDGNGTASDPLAVISTPSESTGWIIAGDTLTYDGADSPSFTATIADDVRDKYSKGMKFRLEQDEALTNYWSFDTDNTEEIAGVVMTNMGTPTYTAGKFGNALTLNGTDQALKCADNTFKPTGAFTVAGWIKITNATNASMIFQSYRNTGTTESGFYIYAKATSGVLECRICKNSGTPSVHGVDLSTITGITDVCDDAYHYIVVTYRNNWCQIYVDGKLESSGYSFAPAYNATTYTRIGVYTEDGTTNSLWALGQIDDLVLVDGYVWDEETIREKYEAGTAQGVGDVTIQKKFLLTDISYDGSNTTLTLYGGTDFALSDSAISNPYFSIVQQPYGFNNEFEKWGNGNPIGEIKMYASENPPICHLACDGSSVSTTTYSKLFQRIGYSYGGSGTSFNIPDYQAVVPKGFGSQTINGRAKSGGDFAEILEDQMQGHRHQIDSKNAGSTGSGGAPLMSNASTDTTMESFTNYAPITYSTYGTPRIGTNTRDSSIGTNFCIRYK